MGLSACSLKVPVPAALVLVLAVCGGAGIRNVSSAYIWRELSEFVVHSLSSVLFFFLQKTLCLQPPVALFALFFAVGTRRAFDCLLSAACRNTCRAGRSLPPSTAAAIASIAIVGSSGAHISR